MKRLLGSVLLLASGFGFGFWLGFSYKPTPKLDYVDNANAEVFSTYVWVKNVTDDNIYLDGATLNVTSLGQRAPQKYAFQADRDTTQRQILLREADNPHKNGKDLKFFTRDGMTIQPGVRAKIRVRIQNRDFPGINVIGNLLLSYSNDRGGKGSLEIRGVSINIESW